MKICWILLLYIWVIILVNSEQSACRRKHRRRSGNRRNLPSNTRSRRSRRDTSDSYYDVSYGAGSYEDVSVEDGPYGKVLYKDDEDLYGSSYERPSRRKCKKKWGSRRDSYKHSSNEKFRKNRRSRNEKEGYIFLCPRALKIGATNELQLKRIGNFEAGYIQVKVLYKENYNSNDSVAIDKRYYVEEGEKEKTFDLFLEPFGKHVYRGKITLNGKFGDYSFNGTDTVQFRKSKDNIVFLQTDKPKYKEGQTVLFRVLIVDKDLKPVENAIGDIWIEDPKGNRWFQKKGVMFKKGMKQFEFPLADEPQQGQWKISASIDKEVTIITFDVEEYVLPKFDVDIQTPPFVLSNAEEIPITICAKYTYGKPVKGNLNLNISLQSYRWSRQANPVLEHEGEIDGCFLYNINVSLVEKTTYYSHQRIQIVALVEESATGVQKKETKYIQRYTSPLNLNFNRNQRQFYKPGLPYNGELQVNNPDNTPAGNEDIQICYTVSRERVLSNWFATRKVKICKNFTSDEEGVIKFIIPPQHVDSVGVSLNAISLNYVKKNKGNSRANSLIQPRTSSSLSPWYSPSGSFIQLQPIQKTLGCDERRQFKLLFTSKKSEYYKFIYQVIDQGTVAKSGKIEKHFNIADDVSEKYTNEDAVINDKKKQLVPQIDPSKPPPSEDNCPASEVAKYLPPIGEAYINLDIDPNWSPNFYLLVYYIRQDRETIADSQKFKVQKCFRNKVTLQFADAVKQPATETTLTVSASRNSLCGVKVVDKSVSILSSKNELNKEKVFQALERLHSNVYYSVNHCTQDTPQPGLAKRLIFPPLPPQPYSYSKYQDSLTAFENSGYVVISDLVLFTRPCKSNVHDNGDVLLSRPNPRSMASRILMASRAAPQPEAITTSAVDVRVYFPETWLFDLVMTGDNGEHVRQEKLPDTITEWIGSAVCLNSEDGLGISEKASIKGFQAFFVSLTLPYSVVRGEKFMITISVFSYVEDPMPIKVTLLDMEGFEVTSESTDSDICVMPGTSTNLKVQLKGTALGQQNLTVKAETSDNTEVCSGPKIYEGDARDALKRSVIVEAEGWPVEEVKSELFCPNDEENGVFEKNFDLIVPNDENFVENSARAFFDVTGNLLGKSLDNINNLIRLPTGCGEQNMAKFCPNLVALELLIASKKDNDKKKNEIIRNLRTGVQRQMRYRRSDGSFSAFGNRDKEGSMFLTAFVLKSFAQAGKYVDIPNGVMKQMQTWIEKKQDSDGCFANVGRIVDAGIAGGIKRSKSKSAITAYVTTSLLISDYKKDDVINKAFNCIENNVDDTIYTQFLYSYAETFADRIDSAKARIVAARNRAITTGGLEFYKDINATKSQNLETNAYAILSILKTGGDASDVLPIVRYLTQNLNSRGGFYSTQDTCMGFGALAEFAKLIFEDTLDLTVRLNGGGLNEELQITKDNELLVTRYKVPNIPSNVKAEAEGSGCALIQSIVRYNTHVQPGQRLFDLDSKGKCLNRECKKASITISVRLVPEGDKTGMALVEVKMPTGFVPIKESLEKLYNQAHLQLMRYEVNNNTVIFYFIQITNEVKRWKFECKEIVSVEDRVPSQVKVYDYYNSNMSARSTYNLEECNSDTCSD